MIKSIIPVAYTATQADINAGLANNLPKGTPIIVVDANAQPIDVKTAQGGGTPPVDSAGLKNNFAGVAAPLVTNDSSQGYSIGSRWIDTTGDESYICVDNTVNAAVWSKTTVGTIAEVAGLQAALDAKLDDTDIVNDLTTGGATKAASAETVKTLNTDKMALYQQGHPFLTSASQAGHIVTQSAQFSAEYAGWRAFQASPVATNEWAVAGAIVASLTIELPQAIVMNRVALRGRASGAEYYNRWQIQGSNDGVDFTAILLDKTAADESLLYSLGVKTFDFANTTAYKYYRFNGTVGVGTNVGLNSIRYFHKGINYLPALVVATTTTAGLLSTTDKTKLDGVATGAEVNVQSDWNAASGDAQILNKPTIPTATTVNDTLTSDSATEALSAKQGKALKTLADGKAPTAHTHAQSDVTGLPAALTAKQDSLTASQVNALGQIISTPTRSIPAFTANTTAGTAGNYVASANSEFNATYAAWKALRATQGLATDEWATLGVLVNIWLAILFPTARVITSARVASRATGTESPQAGWRIEASNDGATWTTLYTSATAMTNVIETVSFVNATAYTRYRMFAPTTAGTNPGMSFFELRHDVIGFATAPAV